MTLAAVSSSRAPGQAITTHHDKNHEEAAAMERTSKRVWGAALVLGVGMALSACPPTYPKCESDAACKEHGEYCVQGQCRQCAVDANCPANFVCQENKCVPKPECTRDDQCGEGKKCAGGKCAVDESAQAPKADPCAQCGPNEVCRDGACVKKPYETVADCQLQPVRFGFNDSALTAEARQAIDAALDCLKAVKGKVVLEGHADDRGTEEYNLQLSNRRAAAVKKYLTDLGVSAGLDDLGRARRVAGVAAVVVLVPARGGHAPGRDAQADAPRAGEVRRHLPVGVG